jgi:hypothetical protein
LRKAANAVLADTYAQKTAQRLGVAADAVRAEFKKLRAPQKTGTDEPGEAAVPAERPSAQELWLLKLLLLDDELPEWAAAHLDLNWVRHAVVRLIISLRVSAHADGRPPSVTALLTQMEDAEARSLVTEAVSEQREIPNRPRQLADVAKRLRDQFIESELKTILRRFNEPDLSDEERITLTTRKLELLRLKSRPLPV